MSSDEVMDRLGKAKVNVAKVNNIGQAADHAQLAAVGGVVEFDDGRQARSRPWRRRSRCKACPCVADRPPPRLAEHTDEILAELGFADDEIAALREEGAFGEGRAQREPRARRIRQSVRNRA